MKLTASVTTVQKELDVARRTLLPTCIEAVYHCTFWIELQLSGCVCVRACVKVCLLHPIRNTCVHVSHDNAELLDHQRPQTNQEIVCLVMADTVLCAKTIVTQLTINRFCIVYAAAFRYCTSYVEWQSMMSCLCVTTKTRSTPPWLETCGGQQTLDLQMIPIPRLICCFR